MYTGAVAHQHALHFSTDKSDYDLRLKSWIHSIPFCFPVNKQNCARYGPYHLQSQVTSRYTPWCQGWTKEHVCVQKLHWNPTIKWGCWRTNFHEKLKKKKKKLLLTILNVKLLNLTYFWIRYQLLYSNNYFDCAGP